MLTSKYLPYQYSKEFLDKAARIATHYGFVPLETVLDERKNRRKIIKKLPADERKKDSVGGLLADTIHTAAEYALGSESDPILLYHFGTRNTKDAPKSIHFGLQTIGSRKTIAEALILKTALAILEEIGLREHTVYVNSLGDEVSAAKFSSELLAYFRKNIAELPSLGRQAFKKDVFDALVFVGEKKHPLKQEMPKPMEFLSDDSRKHLAEVLEYLEAMQVPYEIDDGLVRHGNCYNQTLFEIRVAPHKSDDTEHMIIARGGRYDILSKKLTRKTIPAVGIIFETELKGRIPKNFSVTTKTKRPRVYLIQLGFEAKIHSLMIIDLLQKARIPLCQSLNKDRLEGQFLQAKELNIPYIIIVGHKEALEGTAIIRDTNTHSQETVPANDIVEYFKTMR